jgi:hypothetical protein
MGLREQKDKEIVLSGGEKVYDREIWGDELTGEVIELDIATEIGQVKCKITRSFGEIRRDLIAPTVLHWDSRGDISIRGRIRSDPVLCAGSLRVELHGDDIIV